MKDQLSPYLPALLQIMHGLDGCGLLEIIRRSLKFGNMYLQLAMNLKSLQMIFYVNLLSNIVHHK